ncbi:MBL fold metallo-hydrolase [Ktedonosporobacter rubrisoli]|nr:MBL fold metallo-hydrolase [Ktedonosporobacter rubrisoli]
MDITSDALPSSSHFHLKQLADGVYAAMSREGSGSMSNAGIVDLGDRTLVFDTFLSPTAAQDLRNAAEQLTGRPVSYVVNSHHDVDHIYGNQVFPPATTIIATTQTRDLIATRGAEFLAWAQENLAEDLRTEEKRIKELTDLSQREEAALVLASNHVLLSSLPAITLRVPNLTFEHKLILHGSRRSVELLCYGGGHTPSDSFLYLPKERIAFMGDLLFVGMHASIWQDNPQSWIDILARAEALAVQVAVPGHGTLGTGEHVTIFRDYLCSVQEIALAVHRRGGSEDEAAQEAIPACYASWKGAALFAELMRSCYRACAKSTV